MDSSLPFGKAIVCASRRGQPLFTVFFKTVIVSIALLMLTSFQSYGQDYYWVKLAEQDGVEIHVNYDQCQNAILKVINNNDYPVQIEWSESILNHAAETSTALNQGNTKSLNLAAAGSSTGDCNTDSESALFIDTSANLTPLGDGTADLHIENLKVNQQQ